MVLGEAVLTELPMQQLLATPCPACAGSGCLACRPAGEHAQHHARLHMPCSATHVPDLRPALLLCPAMQNPKDKRQIIIDDKLSTLFKSPLTMFSMNKQLTKHIFKACECCLHAPRRCIASVTTPSTAQPRVLQVAAAPAMRGSAWLSACASAAAVLSASARAVLCLPPPSRHCAAAEVKGAGDSDGEEGSAAPKAKPKPAKRARKAGSDDEDGGGKRKGTGFGKPLPLSDALAAACGKSEMNRGELCKWLYAYCDEHNLKVGVRC